MKIERIVRLHLAPGKEEEFRNIFRESQPVISEFPGCLRVRLLQSTDEPEVFYTQSLWEGEHALEQYRQSDFFRRTWSRTKALFDQPASAWSMAIVDDYL